MLSTNAAATSLPQENGAIPYTYTSLKLKTEVNFFLELIPF